MTESARPHIVMIGKGAVKVLRLHVDAAGVWPFAYVVEKGEPFCRLCGCTDTFGCSPPCSWANHAKTICSRCLERSLLP